MADVFAIAFERVVLGLDVGQIQVLVESCAELLVYVALCVFLDGLEDHQGWDAQEDLGFAAFYLFFEIWVFLAKGLNVNAEFDYLFLLGLVEQLLLASSPGRFIEFHDLNQFLIILQLWVHSIHIASVLLKEQPEALD